MDGIAILIAVAGAALIAFARLRLVPAAMRLDPAYRSWRTPTWRRRFLFRGKGCEIHLLGEALLIGGIGLLALRRIIF